MSQQLFIAPGAFTPDVSGLYTQVAEMAWACGEYQIAVSGSVGTIYGPYGAFSGPLFTASLATPGNPVGTYLPIPIAPPYPTGSPVVSPVTDPIPEPDHPSATESESTTMGVLDIFWAAARGVAPVAKYEAWALITADIDTNGFIPTANTADDSISVSMANCMNLAVVAGESGCTLTITPVVYDAITGKFKTSPDLPARTLTLGNAEAAWLPLILVAGNSKASAKVAVSAGTCSLYAQAVTA